MNKLTGISRAEFARRDGCTPKTVRDCIGTGALKPFDDGSLDPRLVGGAWRKRIGRGKAKDGFVPVIEPMEGDDAEIGDTVTAIAKSQVKAMMSSDGFELLEIAEAERKRVNFQAALAELKYFIESGKVVLIEDVTNEVAKQLQSVRSILLTIPSKLAAKIIACKDAEQARLMILEQVIKSLNEITIDKLQ